MEGYEWGVSAGGVVAEVALYPHPSGVEDGLNLSVCDSSEGG